MSDENTPLSLLVSVVKKRIKNIKKHGNAFVVDWRLIELIELIIEKIDKKA